MEKILITGALGQLGTELVEGLTEAYGHDAIVASDLADTPEQPLTVAYESLNVLLPERIEDVIRRCGITQIYHLAAILSAKGEENPKKAWEINMSGLFNILEAARMMKLNKVYWPSSIAVFGNDTPRDNTPQDTLMNPATVYGISKLAGERWCEYYHQHYGLDVRSLRYPGLIGYKSLAGGGTTDYAVDIYHKAINGEEFTCFLEEDTELPMMYMKDAVRATIELMKADPGRIRIRSSYNISGMSFSPKEIYHEIRKSHPEFRIRYAPDFRQQIADSWPNSIDDSKAKADWGWEARYDLHEMTRDIFLNLNQIRIN